jgi:thiamine-monophosphate kinase
MASDCFGYDSFAVPLTEKALIAEIRRMVTSAGQRKRAGVGVRATRSAPAVLAGIGDDCAVLRAGRGREILVTTDFTLEGVHFRRDWHPAEVVGHRCLARGLSDIAAMGGEPLAAFLSLALPRNLSQAWVRRFVRGLIALAQQSGVTLAGGDTAQSPNGILADIVVVGTVPRGTAILRSGARAGDLIYVSGELGGAAAAIERMRRETRPKLNREEYMRHFLPQPRIELGRVLRGTKLASTMIDVSDGLSTDLAHICEESKVGAEIQAELVPRASVGKRARPVDLKFALHGGEDYELLFTASRGKRIAPRIDGVPVTQIGRITRGRKMFVIEEGGLRRELQPQGWEHFRK